MREIRMFLAVNLGVGVLRRVNDVQRALRERCAEDGWDIKWVAPPNLHVVIRYLGEVGVALPAPLAEAMTGQVRPLAPFPLHARGVRTDEAGERSAVIVGLSDPEGGIEALLRALASPLEQIGFRPDVDTREPRMVIGRVRTTGGTPLSELASAAAEADFGESLVTELVAYRSDQVTPGEEFRDLFRIRMTGRRLPRPEAVPEAVGDEEAGAGAGAGEGEGEGENASTPEAEPGEAAPSGQEA